MSKDFAVEYGGLDAYGAQLGELAASATATINGARVDSPSQAMPGGLASGAAGLLQGRYEAAARRVTAHLAEHPAALRAAAAAYREAEDTNEGLAREMFGAR